MVIFIARIVREIHAKLMNQILVSRQAVYTLLIKPILTFNLNFIKESIRLGSHDPTAGPKDHGNRTAADYT